MTDSTISYSDLLAANATLKASLVSSPEIRIAVLSNITIHPIREILEYALRTHGIHAVVEIGRFDNIVQDSVQCSHCKVVLVFWELLPVIENFRARHPIFEEDAEREFAESLTADIIRTLRNLAAVPLVIINRLNTLALSSSAVRPDRVENICSHIANAVAGSGFTNILWVDLSKILCRLSLDRALDWRMYYLTRSLYTREFLFSYIDQLQPELLALFGQRKKALILDCDNTLWKGILGEDGPDNIEMSDATPHGRVFREVQLAILDLLRTGIIIGLSSKNNPQDVELILENHPDMLIRNRHLAIKRVNWDDKVSNLRSIAAELNIGLDSIVFVDDSEYELSSVREQLPEVQCFAVPRNLFSYPVEFRSFLETFAAGGLTEEDSNRTEMYRGEQLRRLGAQQHASPVAFLKSLGLKLTVHGGESRNVARVAQLTQKTNQFNLTTLRYSENEIAAMMADPAWRVMAIEVEDRFGNYGLTGVVLVGQAVSPVVFHIDTLLLSCRVLGRDVEKALMDIIVEQARSAGACEINARYRKTARNLQVEDYYDKCGYTVVDSNQNEKHYVLKMPEYHPFCLEYIEVQYA
jgi:FkbH-like protein